MEVGLLLQVGGHFGLDGLGEQGTGSPSQDVGQRIVAAG
jgi:hypothetical protein